MCGGGRCYRLLSLFINIQSNILAPPPVEGAVFLLCWSHWYSRVFNVRLHHQHIKKVELPVDTYTPDDIRGMTCSLPFYYCLDWVQSNALCPRRSSPKLFGDTTKTWPCGVQGLIDSNCNTLISTSNFADVTPEHVAAPGWNDCPASPGRIIRRLHHTQRGENVVSYHKETIMAPTKRCLPGSLDVSLHGHGVKNMT